MIVVTTGFAHHIRFPFDFTVWMTANPRLGSPQREMASTQIKVGHLLTAAPDVLLLFSRQTHPEAVVVPFQQAELQRNIFVISADDYGHLQQRRSIGAWSEREDMVASRTDMR